MIRKIFALFTPPERRQFYWLLVLLVIASLLEVVGIASILPFMQALSNPDLTSSGTVLGRAYRRLGFTDVNHFRLALGGAVLLLVVVSNGFMILTKTLLTRFIWMRNYTIAKELISRYLHAPYTFFLNRNSADLSKNILSEVGIFMNGLLLPLMDVIAKGLTTVLILTLLVIMDPVVAAAVAATLGGFYATVLLLVQRRLRVMGKRRIEVHASLFQSVTQAFGGIKEIKVLGKEDVFVRSFAQPAIEYSSLNTRTTIMAIIPRHLLEVIAYAVLLAILLYFLTTADTPAQALPVLSVYALAGFRLMPYLEIVYGGITRVRFNLSSLDQLYHDYFEGPSRPDTATSKVTGTVPFDREVSLREVHFTYPEAQQDVLTGMSVTIRKGTTVGLAGTSGSGKTTTVDLLLGLLSPRLGGLFVDDAMVDGSRVRSWQRRLGYVPQHIYLTDGSISENIALGIDSAAVDMARVRAVAQTARLDEFVATLPEGYATVVGERGVRLSGGQRQRIGIARALYHRPDLLILDEATNALDGVTERDVIDAIRLSDTPSTVVIISHRLTALKDCDEIHLFEQGAITLSGTFDQLMAQSEVFRAMARADG